MISYEWRGQFENAEVNALHAEGFGHPLEAGDWRALVSGHSLGWVCARDGRGLVGTGLVALARDEVRRAGCEWLHVDFEDHLRPFYFGSCGFTPTNAGLIALR